jgi:hypothetical protein
VLSNSASVTAFMFSPTANSFGLFLEV